LTSVIHTRNGNISKFRSHKYSICRRAFAEQEDLINQGILTESVETSVKRCPKLDTLSISYANGLNIPSGTPRAVRYISANMPEESRPHYELGITAKILETFQARVLKHLQISFVPLKAIARETNGSYLMSVRAVMPFLESLALGVAYEPTKPENENGHEYWPDKSCLI
jgi:hypothetical protein